MANEKELKNIKGEGKNIDTNSQKKGGKVITIMPKPARRYNFLTNSWEDYNPNSKEEVKKRKTFY